MLPHRHQAKVGLVILAVAVYIAMWGFYIHQRLGRAVKNEPPPEARPPPKKVKRKVARRADSEFCRISKKYHVECEEPWHR
jgi:hypothetical protein